MELGNLQCRPKDPCDNGGKNLLTTTRKAIMALTMVPDLLYEEASLKQQGV